MTPFEKMCELNRLIADVEDTLIENADYYAENYCSARAMRDLVAEAYRQKTALQPEFDAMVLATSGDKV
jgi:GTPase Era involved in 16S rRNA processing